MRDEHEPDREAERSTLRRIAGGVATGCGAVGCVTLAIAAAAVVVIVGVVLAAASWYADAEAYAQREHRDWPRNTRVRALRTRSPGGAFSTFATADNGYADLANARAPADFLSVRARACGEASIGLATQFHARCQDRMDVLACGRPDGRLLHERFALQARWQSATHLEISWTELTSLDRDGHRVWSRRRELYRVTRQRRSEVGEDDECETCDDGEHALCVTRTE